MSYIVVDEAPMYPVLSDALGWGITSIHFVPDNLVSVIGITKENTHLYYLVIFKILLVFAIANATSVNCVSAVRARRWTIVSNDY